MRTSFSSALAAAIGVVVFWTSQPRGQQIPRSGELPDEVVIFSSFRQSALRYPFSQHLRLFKVADEAEPALTDSDLRQLAAPLERVRAELVRSHRRFRAQISGYVGRSVAPQVNSRLSILNAGANIAQAISGGRIQIDARVLLELVRAELDELSVNRRTDGIELARALKTLEEARDRDSFVVLYMRGVRRGNRDVPLSIGDIFPQVMAAHSQYVGGLRFLVAHELGHIALGHLQQTLDCDGRRAAENEADRYAVVLLPLSMAFDANDFANAPAAFAREMSIAGGHTFFLLQAYERLFSASSGTCRIYPPAVERAAKLAAMAERVMEQDGARLQLEFLRRKHETFAPDVTRMVTTACRLPPDQATEMIESTVDYYIGMYDNVPNEIDILKFIRQRLRKNDPPGCNGNSLFE